jgi:hypothetical protein
MASTLIEGAAASAPRKAVKPAHQRKPHSAKPARDYSKPNLARHSLGVHHKPAVNP